MKIEKIPKTEQMDFNFEGQEGEPQKKEEEPHVEENVSFEEMMRRATEDLYEEERRMYGHGRK